MHIHNLIDQLRSPETEVFDDALEQLRGSVQSAKWEIYRSATQESDPHAKGALIELLGESKDSQFMQFLAGELESEHPEVRFWAFVALQRLGTPEALRIAQSGDLRAIVTDVCRRRAG